jgi:hypothetical protein
MSAVSALQACGVDEMDATVFFKSTDGVKAVKLPAAEALRATRKHPHEFSLTRCGFAEPPEGWVPSDALVAFEKVAAAMERFRAIAGASVKAD